MRDHTQTSIAIVIGSDKPVTTKSKARTKGRSFFISSWVTFISSSSFARLSILVCALSALLSSMPYSLMYYSRKPAMDFVSESSDDLISFNVQSCPLISAMSTCNWVVLEGGVMVYAPYNPLTAPMCRSPVPRWSAAGSARQWRKGPQGLSTSNSCLPLWLRCHISAHRPGQ